MAGRIYRNTKPAKDDKRTLHFSIIIPSAGEGTRIKSFGPRSLLPVNNCTVIERQTQLIREVFPNSQIILVSGFEANKLMNRAPNGIISIENERYLETNVLRSIGIGLRACIHDHVIVLYGDLVFNQELLEFPLNKSCVLHSTTEIVTETEVGCTINDGKLENMFYGLPNKWFSVLYLTGKELKLFKTIAFDKQKEKMYGWEAVNETIESGGEFMAYSPKGAFCTDIDSSKDIENVKNISF